MSSNKRSLPYRTQIFIAFFLIAFSLALTYYYRNINLQNNILRNNFIRNNQLIFKTVKLGLEVGLKADNFAAIKDVFSYAREQKDLEWIIITDSNQEVFAYYPEDLDAEENLKQSKDHIFSVEESSHYIEKGLYNAPLGSGSLIISFKTASYQIEKKELRDDSIILTSIILLITIFISYLLSRFLINPLTHLQDTIHKITSGDFHEKISYLSKTREIQSLTGSFNQMMDEINEERGKSENLLLNVLPPPIAKRLKTGERTIALSNPSASILFADLVGYTAFSKNKSPEEVVSVLNEIFTSFDLSIAKLGLEKIKTIGDSYMVAGGLFTPEDECEKMLKLAKNLFTCLEDINHKFDTNFKIRIGIHSGPVVAGVLGKIKFSFDIWGNTVNMASRLESKGTPGRIHFSQQFIDSLKSKNITIPNLESNTFEAKGIGLVQSYIL